jgi:hypothetical protein
MAMRVPAHVGAQALFKLEVARAALLVWSGSMVLT